MHFLLNLKLSFYSLELETFLRIKNALMTKAQSL
jgi:hypothetical protein